MVFGEPTKIGFYPHNNRRLVSITSAKEFALGIPEPRAKWIEKQTVLAMIRKQKELKRNLTQKEALEFGKIARAEILDRARKNGTETHAAIQNHHSQLPYELEEYTQPYFNSYKEWAKNHKIIPILQEEKVYNFDYGYAGRFDFYGEIDGKKVLVDYKTSNFIDWSMGLQLAAYRKCIEDLGHIVDEMWIIHLIPRKQRGGLNATPAIPYKFTTSFRKWEALMELFYEKLNSDPNVSWYPRTDEGAVQDQIKKENAIQDQKDLHGF